MVLSTGMRSMEAMRRVQKIVKGHNQNFTMLQCTSAYALDPTEVNLSVITERWIEQVSSLSLSLSHSLCLEKTPNKFVIRYALLYYLKHVRSCGTCVGRNIECCGTYSRRFLLDLLWLDCTSVVRRVEHNAHSWTKRGVLVWDVITHCNYSQYHRVLLFTSMQNFSAVKCGKRNHVCNLHDLRLKLVKSSDTGISVSSFLN